MINVVKMLLFSVRNNTRFEHVSLIVRISLYLVWFGLIKKEDDAVYVCQDRLFFGRKIMRAKVVCGNSDAKKPLGNKWL